MKLTVLCENTTAREDILAEHGLSLYLETGGVRILFDMGQTDAFARNADTLGIDLAKVDFAVLSHGHYDHGGGLGTFLERNHTAPIYLSQHAFGGHYHGPERGIGLDRSLMNEERLVFVEEEMTLSPTLSLHHYSKQPLTQPIEPYGLTMEQGGVQMPEDFRHEQYLLVEEGGRRILISGCSHRGVLNLMAWVRPDVLVGGFHFMKLEPTAQGRLGDAAAALRQYPTKYYTGHCTGTAQYAVLQQVMGEQLAYLSAGMEVEV